MRAYKLLLWKAYFDKGWGLTNYFKYVLVFFGLYEILNVRQAMYFILFYLMSCMLIGWVWFRSGLVDTENEIQNIFNPFQKEMRARLKVTKL